MSTVSKQSIGKVAVVPKGEWNATVQYEPLDLVVYGSSSFIALQSTKGNPPNPTISTVYWQLVAAGGASAPQLNTNGILYWPSV